MTEGVWDTIPNSVKAGEPLDISQLQYMETGAADALVWEGGVVVIPDTSGGGMKKCDANASVLKKVGIAHFAGKALNVRMGAYFVAPAKVWIKYVDATTIKNNTLLKTKNDGTLVPTSNNDDACARVLHKLGESGGGTGELQTDIVQNDYIAIQLLEGGT
jgi:hypothetical protein